MKPSHDDFRKALQRVSDFGDINLHYWWVKVPTIEARERVERRRKQFTADIATLRALITPEAGDTATDGGRCPTCGRGRADLSSDQLLAAIRGEQRRRVLRERLLAALTFPDTDPLCTEPCSYDPGCPRECTEDCEPVSVDEDGGRK